jgi:hypothetical protein
MPADIRNFPAALNLSLRMRDRSPDLDENPGAPEFPGLDPGVLRWLFFEDEAKAAGDLTDTQDPADSRSQWTPKAKDSP